VKYTGKGGEVKMKLYKKNNHARIEISDTGIGISKKDLSHIFERFYRIETIEDPNNKGTGLGLAICK